MSRATQQSFQFLRTIDHPERVKEIIDVVTDVYEDSPLFQYIFGGHVGGDVRKGLDWQNRQRLEQAGANSLFWLDAEGRVEGHFICSPPVSPEAAVGPAKPFFNETEMLELFGEPALQRQTCLFKEFAAHRGGAARSAPTVDQVWTFGMFAVRPGCQGRGLGSAVMRQLFAQWMEPIVSAGLSVRIDLMSQMEQNLTLYRRLGFECIAEGRLTSDDDAAMDVPNWVFTKHFPKSSM